MRLNYEVVVLARCKKGEIVKYTNRHWTVGPRAEKLVRLQRGKRVQTVMANTRVGRIVGGRVLA